MLIFLLERTSRKLRRKGSANPDIISNPFNGGHHSFSVVNRFLLVQTFIGGKDGNEKE